MNNYVSVYCGEWKPLLHANEYEYYDSASFRVQEEPRLFQLKHESDVSQGAKKGYVEVLGRLYYADEIE